MGEQFTQDAASRPHVNRSGLCARIQQELRGSIPQSNHLQVTVSCTRLEMGSMVGYESKQDIVHANLPWAS